MKNLHLLKACMLLFLAGRVTAQSCPATGTITLNSYSNTYYPVPAGTVSAGATSLVLGNASTSGYGTTPISQYDIVLIIQMQGAQINAVNSASYGDGTGTGSGYLNNANLMAGHMEYAVAMNAVPLTGGTLTVQTGLTYSYKSAVFGTDGQYSYQVIRIPLYNNLTLGANITPPQWNGSVGGVIDLYVDGTLNMSGFNIDASGTGFRGGGGKNWSGPSGNTNTDFIAAYNNKSGGSKGEGIAGTPYYLYSMGSPALFNSGVDGYPGGGSYDRGAPGNAGGGATDGLMSNNSNNAGGGGGGNGGSGGGGGNSWNSNLQTGGRGGTLFAQQSPSRLVMGGGGGAGSTDGGTGTPGSGYASSGAPGGGIVIITASSITGTGSVLANGAAPNTTVLNDGSGGGGAGGSILIITGANSPGLTANANGSAGASNTGGGSAAHGPGGGGGGGIVYSNKSLLAASVAPGAAGTTFGATTYNAKAGFGGVTSQTINVTQIPHFPIICNGLLTTQSLTATASHENNSIVIRWRGITADAVEEYEVQRSGDSTGFVTIATVSPEAAESYIDVLGGNTAPVMYYRVRQRNVSGSIVYSNVAVVDLPVGTMDVSVAPNPTMGPATLRFNSDGRATIPISLYDLTGRPLWRRQYPANPGINVLSIDPLRELPNGIYILQLTTAGNVVKTVRITLIH